MATVRVYHPDTCEPFDVTPSKATKLVLEQGWSKTPWKRVEAPIVIDIEEELPEVEEDVVVETAPRGRGRRRRAAEQPAEDVQDGFDNAPSDFWRG